MHSTVNSIFHISTWINCNRISEGFIVTIPLSLNPPPPLIIITVIIISIIRPPLWFLATHPEVRVRFPALPDLLRSSGSGTGSTQLVSTIEEPLERKSSGSGLEIEITAVGDPLR
jgi:hypothetical protein